jgi:hypothetical protein
MLFFYVFALVVGGGMLLFSVFGQDVDDLGDAHGGHDALKLLSLRTLTYSLFAFGAVGAILSKVWSWAAAPLVLLVAAVTGLAVGAAVSLVFRYLQRTTSGERESDDSFIGLVGRVTIPIAGGSGMGKVLIERGGRTFELLARPLETAEQAPAKWKSVIVVEMSKGTAVVAPVDDPSVREISTLGQ